MPPVEITPQLLDAIAFEESNMNPKAVSPRGARGMYQFMPVAWADVQQNFPNLSQYGYEEGSFDPDVSRRFAEALLNLNLKRLGEGADLDKLLASYNYGIGNVLKEKKYPRETQDYIKKIKERLKIKPE